MEQQDNTIEKVKLEIERILKEYNITLVPTIVHQGDRTFSRIDIIKLPEEGSVDESVAEVEQ